MYGDIDLTTGGVVSKVPTGGAVPKRRYEVNKNLGICNDRIRKVKSKVSHCGDIHFCFYCVIRYLDLHSKKIETNI